MYWKSNHEIIELSWRTNKLNEATRNRLGPMLNRKIGRYMKINHYIAFNKSDINPIATIPVCLKKCNQVQFRYIPYCMSHKTHVQIIVMFAHFNVRRKRPSKNYVRLIFRKKQNGTAYSDNSWTNQTQIILQQKAMLLWISEQIWYDWK